jgi:hypothetical protein
MDEAVLHRLVGGTSVMRDQLQQVVDVAALHNVTVQVIPYSSGAHPALESTFYILDFDEAVPSVVYVEGLVGWIYLERNEDITRYRHVFERLSRMALTPEKSVKLISRVRKSYADSLEQAEASLIELAQ